MKINNINKRKTSTVIVLAPVLMALNRSLQKLENLGTFLWRNNRSTSQIKTLAGSLRLTLSSYLHKWFIKLQQNKNAQTNFQDHSWVYLSINYK